MFHNFRSLTRKIGGAFHVWHEVSRKRLIGGKLPQSYIKEGVFIPVGTPVEVTGGADSVAKPMEVFVVAKDVTATDTEVQLKLNQRLPYPKSGEFLMPAPKLIEDKGKGVAVTDVAIDESNGVVKVTIDAGALGTLKAGDLLINADKAGASAVSYAKPNALIHDDVKIVEGEYERTVAGVNSGVIYEDRITPVPACVKALLPMITFEPNI